jgi:ribosomal protein S27AE
MPAGNFSKQAFMNLLGLDSRETVEKPVVRVQELQDIRQVTAKHTRIDPTAGRLVTTLLPAASLTASGHLVPELGGLIGECVMCRQLAERQGQPELVTLVPKGEGGGGVCARCQSVFCVEHAAIDEQGRWWCEECQYEEGFKKTGKALLGVLFGKLIRRGAADE